MTIAQVIRLQNDMNFSEAPYTFKWYKFLKKYPILIIISYQWNSNYPETHWNFN